MSRGCNHCGCHLDSESWAVGNVKKNNYICRICDSIKGKRNRLKRLAIQIGEATFRKYSKVKDGYVYIISNPAWPEWIKVGMAIDATDRCSSYQTSSPYRDYVMHYAISSDDRRKSESEAHTALEKLADSRKGEWFKIPVDSAVECMATL